MTSNRRQFTFGALMLALSGKARADEPSDAPAPQAPSPPAAPSDPPALEASYEARRVGDELHIDLSLANDGEPTDLISRWGSRLGPVLVAAIAVDGEQTELARVIDVDRRELVSRVGPRPQFAPLAKGGRLDIGTYRFAWVEGWPEGEVELTLTVEATTGPVTLGPEVVTWKRAAT